MLQSALRRRRRAVDETGEGTNRNNQRDNRHEGVPAGVISPTQKENIVTSVQISIRGQPSIFEYPYSISLSHVLSNELSSLL